MVQPRKPANGIEIAISDVDISIPRHSPATVATGRENDSLRRNQKRPSPPSNGFRTMSARIAAPGDNVENRSIGGTYSQPLWGSAANR